MNKSIKFVGGLLLSVGLLVACGDDSSDNGGGGSDTGGGGNNPTTGGGGSGAGEDGGGGSGDGGGGGNGGKPEKGAPIDRMGRPAINTALNGAFVQFDGTDKVASDSTQRLADQDAYNEDNQPNDWDDNYTEIFAANLGILDTLDASAGNPQPGACQNPVTSNGSVSNVDSYDFVAAALTNDRLFVYADGEGCSAAAIEGEGTNGEVGGYLSAEAAALAGLTLTGCAGRRPIDDVIETTYSIVAAGGLAGVDDGIGPEDVPEGSHPEVFPYIGEPL